MTQWISAVIDYIYPAMARELIFPRIVAPARGQPVDEARVLAAMPKIERQLDILNDALAGKTWLAGEAFSLADILVAPILFYVGLTPEGQDALPRRSALSLWKSRVGDRDSFASTLPPRG
jgi:glutathione S-transferase